MRNIGREPRARYVTVRRPLSEVALKKLNKAIRLRAIYRVSRCLKAATVTVEILASGGSGNPATVERIEAAIAEWPEGGPS